MGRGKTKGRNARAVYSGAEEFQATEQPDGKSVHHESGCAGDGDAIQYCGALKLQFSGVQIALGDWRWKPRSYVGFAKARLWDEFLGPNAPDVENLSLDLLRERERDELDLPPIVLVNLDHLLTELR